MRNKIYLKGFTLADVMISMIIVGILFAMTVLNVKGIVADNNTARFKKAYANLEKTLAFLVSEQSLYGSISGFKDTDAVIIKKTSEILGQDPASKFRDCFKYYIDIVKDNIPCSLYQGSSSMGCFQTGEGVVWGIPDTDFVKKNVITIEDSDGDPVVAVPITIYLDYNEASTIEHDAIVAAITYEGRITLLRNIEGVNCKKDPKAIQCNIDKYINATTIKIDDSTK